MNRTKPDERIKMSEATADVEGMEIRGKVCIRIRHLLIDEPDTRDSCKEAARRMSTTAWINL